MPSPSALITGGAVRLGKEIALSLAQAGYDIALHYHHSQTAAETTAQAIRATGRQCVLFQADLEDSTAAAALLPAVFKAFPTCSLLINNASIFQPGRFRETSVALLEKHLAINFTAPFLLTQGFAAKAPQGSLVVNILDTYMVKNKTSHFAYLLSKRLLWEFTRMAAVELGPQVRVNAIAPGIVFPESESDPDFVARTLDRLPLHQFSGAKGITVALQALIAAPFMTGQCIFADDGEHLL